MKDEICSHRAVANDWGVVASSRLAVEKKLRSPEVASMLESGRRNPRAHGSGNQETEDRVDGLHFPRNAAGLRCFQAGKAALLRVCSSREGWVSMSMSWGEVIFGRPHSVSAAEEL
jgi:hypothetical protein